MSKQDVDYKKILFDLGIQILKELAIVSIVICNECQFRVVVIVIEAFSYFGACDCFPIWDTVFRFESSITTNDQKLASIEYNSMGTSTLIQLPSE